LSLLQNSNAISTGVEDYNLESSLRFRSSASAYLQKTLSSSRTDAKKQTISVWLKRGKIGALQSIIGGYDGGSSNRSLISFQTTDYLEFYTGYSSNILYTSNVFRDTSSWYHIVYTLDSTQATSTNRVKLYINGVQQTLNGTYPPLNYNFQFVYPNANNYIGTLVPANRPFDGYMTEFNFVDGQALDANDFGKTDTTTGAWKPKEYLGTYGTNGFHLDMSTSGSTITDQSGNGNNFTASNMNLTTSTATTYDKMLDVPTLTDEDTANFATLNAVDLSNSSYTPTNANLTYNITGGNQNNQRGSIAVDSGKWYWECTIQTGGGNALIGVARADLKNDTTINFNSANGWYYYGLTGNKYNSGNQGSYGSTYTTGDVIGFALDMDSGKIWWSKNGTWQASGNPAAGTNAGFTNVSGLVTSNVNNGFGGTLTGDYNYGQRPFAYTPPTGFKKLNTYNLPDSTIVDGSQYMNTITWTGDNTSPRSFTGVGFSPDLTWIKRRNSVKDHALFDSVRGSTKKLESNTTIAEITGDNGKIDSFDSDGFTVSTGTTDNSGVNSTSNTFVGWSWRGSDSSAVSNTDGTITSTVSANTTSGFSIVTYTGNGTAGSTIGHGLGNSPDIIITKSRTSANDWAVYHSSLTATDAIILNQAAAAVNNSAYWNDTEPTSSVFTVGTALRTNRNGQDFVAYCFAEVEGFSKFGSYEGNGSADGPFVYTGFRPAFILFKNADDSRQWGIVDTSRSTYNQTNATLEPSTSNAENPYDDMDFLSNGFKPRTTDPGSNRSGYTIIYMAFAENPFKQSLAR